MEKLLVEDSHFKSIVKVLTQSRMRDFANFVFDEDKLSSLGEEVNRESIGAKSLECVSGVPHDGWWPFQDGGFEVSEFFVSGNGYTGSFFCEEEREHAQFMSDRCWKDFLTDGKIDTSNNEDFTFDDLTSKQQEEFNDYERDYLGTEVLLRVVTSIRDGGITLSKRVNYCDAPYYRHFNDLVLKEKDLSEKEFLKLSNEQLWELIK